LSPPLTFFGGRTMHPPDPEMRSPTNGQVGRAGPPQVISKLKYRMADSIDSVGAVAKLARPVCVEVKP
jgi:hypothetical protein